MRLLKKAASFCGSAELAERGWMAEGAQGSERSYQRAAFALHSVQDSLGAHSGYPNDKCQGHASAATTVDRKLDSKFDAAANKVFQMMKGDSTVTPSSKQLKILKDTIKEICDKELWYPKITVVAGGGGGGYLLVYSGGGISDLDWPDWGD